MEQKNKCTVCGGKLLVECQGRCGCDGGGTVELTLRCEALEKQRRIPNTKEGSHQSNQEEWNHMVAVAQLEDKILDRYQFPCPECNTGWGFHQDWCDSYNYDAPNTVAFV